MFHVHDIITENSFYYGIYLLIWDIFMEALVIDPILKIAFPKSYVF